MSYQAFVNEVKKGFPAPAYLFVTSDPFLMREAVRTVKMLVPPDERDFNVHVFDYPGDADDAVTIDGILEVANTVSFFGGKRFTIVAGNVQKIPKKDLVKLGAYVANPAPRSALILFHEGVLKKEIREKFGAFNPVSIDIRESDIPQWIRESAMLHGVDITHEAIEYLIAVVGTDLGRLSSEIQKVSVIGKTRITTDDIVDIVVGAKTYGTFDLVRALTARNADNVFRIYRSLQDISDDYGLIGALNWQYGQLSEQGSASVREEYLPRVFELLSQADIDIKSSGRQFPMEFLLVKLLRLQKSRSPFS